MTRIPTKRPPRPSGLYSKLAGPRDAQIDVYAAIAKAPKGRGRGRRGVISGIWKQLEDQAEVLNYRPELAPDVEVKTFELRWGNDYAVIFNPRDVIHYRLDPGELELLAYMDGSRTVAEIVIERFQATGELDISSVGDLVRQLAYGNFLTERSKDVYRLVEDAQKKAGGFRASLGQFAKTLTVEWKGAEKVIAWFYDHGVKHLFNRWAQIPLALIGVAGLFAFFQLAKAHDFRFEHAPLNQALMLLGLSYSLTFVHELAHGAVIHHHGRRIKSAGFLIYFGSTAFFIDSTDAFMLDRKQRIAMSFAGPYSEMILAGIVSIAAWTVPGTIFFDVFYMFAVLNYFVVFLNLVPFLELDGYWIFSEIVQVPDLRKRSLNFVRYDLLPKLFNRQRLTLQQWGLAIYAIAGFAFTVFWVRSSFFFWQRIFGTVVRSLWNGGLITKLILLLILTFLSRPILKLIMAIARSAIKQGKAAFDTIRFKLETSWRIEAAELLDQMPMFAELDQDTLEDLAGRVRLVRLGAGQPVVRQGEPADAFYVVRRGVLSVVEELPSGNARVLRTLGPGEGFGELGLIDSAPRKATVRAETPAHVFEVDKATFDRLLADAVQPGESTATVAEVRELKSLPCFDHLEPDELTELLANGEWLTVPAGHVFFRQGDKGDDFWAIKDGQVEIVKSRKVIQTLGPGSFFGELALLFDSPRAATVRARTGVRAFRLSRRGFKKLMKDSFKKGTLKPTATVRRMWEH